ncbi:MAG: hypothetical protein HY000_04200 [Planctomycetes bacterium]|nr:hypothetical protein [Planctomycetota bacterium]
MDRVRESVYRRISGSPQTIAGVTAVFAGGSSGAQVNANATSLLVYPDLPIDPTLSAANQSVGVRVSNSVNSAGTVVFASKRQTRRFLRVANQTGEKMSVYVQYANKRQPAKGLEWVPADPASAEGNASLAYELEPGESTYLSDQGGSITAAIVRLWGVTASGDEFVDFRDQDLWLVPELQADGEHYYLGKDVQDFTFAFAR